jgi:hypothetical protein
MVYPLVVPVAHEGPSPHAALKRKIKLVVVESPSATARGRG